MQCVCLTESMPDDIDLAVPGPKCGVNQPQEHSPGENPQGTGKDPRVP